MKKETQDVFDKIGRELIKSFDSVSSMMKEHLATYTPESLEDDSTREEYVFAMNVYDSYKALSKRFKENLDEMKKKEENKSDETVALGFLSGAAKKAA